MEENERNGRPALEPFDAASRRYDDARRHAAIVLSPNPETRCFLEAALVDEFQEIQFARRGEEARQLAEKHTFDTLIVDVHCCGAKLVREIWASVPFDVNAVLLSEDGDLTRTMAALQDIDADLLRKPFQAAELLTILHRSRERRRIAREHFLLQRHTDQRPINERVVGESAAIKELWRIVNRVAPMATSVLITGETGTGKELAARALHDLSGRQGSFVPVNCAAISAEVVESELFGHVKGAFTGAMQSRQGLFGHADRGTLFLDEIGELPQGMQAKLLRVLEQKCYRPVGANREIQTTARVVLATNRDLEAEVAAGRFRKDLLYRVNVLTLQVPPLRERKCDIARLSWLFLHLHAVELGLPMPELATSDLEAMLRYDWPGNIRELRNVIERSLLLGTPIAELLGPIRPATAQLMAAPAPLEGGVSLKHLEHSCFIQALHEAGGNKTAAARILGVSRRTVDRRIKRLRTNGNGAGPREPN